jgi:hypothetical protein
VSALRFYVRLDLQYRHHRFRGRSAISFGTLRWAAWTGKRHRMNCYMNNGSLCGETRRVPHPKNIWSLDRWYTPFRFPSPGYFRFRASACVGPWCGFGQTRSPPIRCVPANERCYFDVD